MRWLRQLRRGLRRPKTLALAVVVLGGILLSGYLVWRARWHISRQAIQMADTTVRQWAQDEVARLSHGAYHLHASTIRVDEVGRSLSVDTIRIDTDSLAAVSGATPLPILSLRFHHCVLNGIDLTRLLAGRGLHIGTAGCDSVISSANMSTLKVGTDSLAGVDSTTFLALTRNLKLPRQIPSVDIDRVAFPTVTLDLAMRSGSGRSSALALDRLAVRLDSLHYDPDQPARERRTLLSRHARVTLDHFTGSREGSNRLDIDRLVLDLSQESAALDGFRYAPLPGRRTDSLGIETLALRHLRVGGVDWRALLRTGDIHVARIDIDSADVGILPGPAAVAMGSPARSIETSLRALDRVVRVDSLVGHDLHVATRATPGHAGSTVTVDALRLTQVDIRPDESAWAAAFPVGRITMSASGVRQRSGFDQVEVAHLGLDLVAQTASADGVRSGPVGSDADFRRRSRYAQDRVVLAVDSVHLLGADFLQYIRRRQYLARRVDLLGASMDVLTEDSLPSRPARARGHRMPQAALRAMGMSFGIDTLTVRGGLTLRERDANAATPGVLTFDRLAATFLNATNDPARMSDSTPLQVTIDARIMGAAPVHISATVPLLASDFRMQWQARIGEMPTAGFNPFLVNAAGMRFEGGTLLGVAIAVRVRNGRARGTIQPRWKGLRVAFPGVARHDSGLLGGIRRGLTKFVANAFAVRDDNVATPGHPALDGVIDHQWTSHEALPAFIWFSLRDPLLGLLKH